MDDSIKNIVESIEEEIVDPKHVLMRLGILYLRDHGDRTLLRKGFLIDGALQKYIDATIVRELPDNMLMVMLGDFKNEG